MAFKKISALTAATSVDGTETIEIVQSSTSKKATLNLIGAGLSPKTLADGDFTAGNYNITGADRNKWIQVTATGTTKTLTLNTMGTMGWQVGDRAVFSLITAGSSAVFEFLETGSATSGAEVPTPTATRKIYAPNVYVLELYDDDLWSIKVLYADPAVGFSTSTPGGKYVKAWTSGVDETVEFVLLGTAAGASTTQTDWISGTIEAPDNQDYTFTQKCPIGGTITNTITKCLSGTCTATFKINTTALGGTANSVSSAEQDQAHSTSNAFSAGDDLVVTISANSSCVDLAFTVVFTYTLS